MGLLGWFEDMEGNYFQDHATAWYREYELEGPACILKISQLRNHGKFGPMILLVASILWLNTVLQLQSQLLAWFTAALEYPNVQMTSFLNMTARRRLTDITSQTTRGAWRAEWGGGNRSCLNTVSIWACRVGLGFLNGTALQFPWTTEENLYL